MSDKASSQVVESVSKGGAAFWVVLGLIVVLSYFYFTSVRFDEKNLIAPDEVSGCLNGHGLNKMSEDEFESKCLDKSFSVVAYSKGCSVDSDCELSLSNTRLPGFDSNTLFEAELEKVIGYMDDKVEVKGVVVDRGFLGQVEVEVFSQKVVQLSPKELAEIEEARKPEIDPVAEAQKMWLEQRASENARMKEYADNKHKELTAKSTRVQVDPNSINGMAEYRYYLKGGKIVSCLRGFEACVLVYECKDFHPL